MVSRRSTNFHKGEDGNSLNRGEDLTIKITPREGEQIVYVIGRLFKKKFFGWQMIQLEMTGRKSNPEKDRITFEMKDYNGGRIADMPTGKYKVTTYCYIKNVGGKRWSDEFEVV